MWPWNPDQRSLKVIATYTQPIRQLWLLLTLHSNRDPISYRFWDKWRFLLKIANFSTPLYLTPPLKGFRGSSWNWISAEGVEKARVIGLREDQNSFKIGLAVRHITGVCLTSSHPSSDLSTAKTALTHSVAQVTENENTDVIVIKLVPENWCVRKFNWIDPTHNAIKSSDSRDA